MTNVKLPVALCCLLSLGWLVVGTLHWPFAGDAALMHYVVFLTGRGMAPYRDIVELNTPAAYLLEHASMALYGWGALGWRLFDFTLLAVTGLACLSILRRWDAALFAATLFAAIHAQDGVMMSGQRDLQVAVLELAALACLLRGLRAEPSASFRRSWIWLWGFGLLASCAVCDKPSVALFPIAAVACVIIWATLRPAGSVLPPIVLGAVIPAVISVAYLASYHALSSFWTMWRSLVAYHAQLDRKPLPFLLTHAFSPVMALFVLYLALLALQWRTARKPTLTSALLAVSAAAGWISYAAQGKGFPYQRYPFLIFLLPLIALAVFDALDSVANASSSTRWTARVALATGVILMLLSAYKAGTFSHADPYRQMAQDLRALGDNGLSGRDSLSGKVQCMDTTGGCIATLYQGRLVQSTGNFYDCYLMDGKNAVVQALRRRLEAEFAAHPPQVFLITDSVCYSQPRSFDKFSDWPAFTGLLATQYRLVTERSFTTPVRYWTRGELPYAYRIYVRR